MKPGKSPTDDPGLSPDQIHLVRQFEADYNEIDAFLRQALSAGPKVDFSRLVRDYSDQHLGWRDDHLLQLAAKIRNLIVRNRSKANPYVAIPAPAIARQLHRCLTELRNPARAQSPVSSTNAEGDECAVPPRISFDRYIGIDYSGAETPDSSLAGLSVYVADRMSAPVEIPPQPSPRRYWTRQEIAEWLLEQLREARHTLVGIDHGFSFPLRYFEKYGLAHDWPAFLDDFQKHWPTDRKNTYVDFVRDGVHGNGAARVGDSHWRRLTEHRSRAKSVFHFDAPGSVAKATHAGLPWLRYLRQNLGTSVHFWPFDGWSVPEGKSVVEEAYPSLWNKAFATDGRNSHQHDAYSIAAWMRNGDRDGSLAAFFHPSLTPEEREVAGIEGWILGVR